MSLGKVKRFFIFTFHFALCTTFLLLLTGCAEMISGAKPEAGSVLRVQVEFGADPSTENYKYVFVYSQQEINLPNESNYIFLPGQDFLFPITENITRPSNNEIINASKDVFVNFYYENYFSSWSDYIYIAKDSKIKLYDATTTYFPVTANQSINYDSMPFSIVDLESTGYGSLAISGSNDYHLDFQFQLQALGDSKPLTDQRFYFKFFTINEDNTLYSSIDGYIKNNKKERPYQKSGGSGSTKNDIYRIKVTVI